MWSFGYFTICTTVVVILAKISWHLPGYSNLFLFEILIFIPQRADPLVNLVNNVRIFIRKVAKGMHLKFGHVGIKFWVVKRKQAVFKKFRRTV